MRKVLVIVPFPLSTEGVDNRRAQTQWVALGPDIEFDFRPVRISGDLLDSPHDWLLTELGVYQAGIEAQNEGYDAVCIDTMSDSGIAPLRSVLDIPVIGPANSAYMLALTLGKSFGIVSYPDPVPEPFRLLYKKALVEHGVSDRCVAIRGAAINCDFETLLTGSEEEAFPALVEAGEACIADGADVIVLGSTTLHQAGDHLAAELPVPVINPGPLTYKLAELCLDLRLTHSRSAYPAPGAPKLAMTHAMLDAAEAHESRPA